LNLIKRVFNWLPLILCACFVAYSATFVLGQFQTDNGDFDQYAVHARNLVLMRPWSFIVAGFPGVLPGYPMVLAITFLAFGLNLYVVGILNAVFWAAYAYVFFIMCKDRFLYRSTSYIYIILLLTSCSLLVFQQEGQPNLFFAATCALALLGSQKIENAGATALAIVAVLLPAIVRVESIALYASIFVYALYARNTTLTKVALIGIVITASLDFFISRYAGMTSNFTMLERMAHAPGTHGTALREHLSAFLYMLVSYVVGVERWILPPTIRGATWLTFEFSPRLIATITFTSLLLAALVIVGVVRRPLWNLDKIYLCAHLAAISCLILPEAPQRYTLPIVGIAVFYAVQTIELIVSRARFLGRYRASCVAVLLICSVLIPSLRFVPRASAAPRASNYHFAPSILAVADMLSRENCSTPIAYYKTRIMMLLMDVRGCDPSIFNLRSPADVNRALQRNALLVSRKGYPYYGLPTVENYLHGRAGIEKLWEDKDHVIYRRK
jgi:hypothetical protein